jgi:hypothetical protein
MAKYAEMTSIEAGLKFKSIGGNMVETTGVSQNLDVDNIYVHEVVITDGTGKGYKYLYNLDSAEEL